MTDELNISQWEVKAMGEFPGLLLLQLFQKRNSWASVMDTVGSGQETATFQSNWGAGPHKPKFEPIEATGLS